MKIAFLSYFHGHGGAQKQNVMLANAMADLGHEVIIVSISENDIVYSINESIRIIPIVDKYTNLLRIPYRSICIAKELYKFQPDVTVNFWFQSAYICSVLPRRITGKIIYCERTDPGNSEYDAILGFIRKIIFPFLDGFVFQSKGAQEYFNNSIIKKSVVIPNPVAIDIQKYPLPENRIHSIVTVGRLHKQKNQKLLIDAFCKLEGYDDYVLEIYGDGPLYKELEDYISDKNLTGRVFLRGTSSNIYDLIYRASLFVLTSDYEGMPNTLLEANVLGIPCISTDCSPGGAREIISDGVNGLIVPRDNKYSLLQAMDFILNNPSISKEFSIAGRNSYYRYQPKKIYKQWEDYFVKISGYENE